MLILQNGAKCIIRLIIAICLIAVAGYATSSFQDSLLLQPDAANHLGEIPRISSSGSLFEMPNYVELLEEFPVITKSVTSGMIGFLGDYLAQFFEVHIFKSRIQYHHYRAFCVSIEGFAVSGPVMHYAFEFLAKFTNERDDATDFEKWMSALETVVLDSVFMSCFFVATLMIVTAILEGHTRRIPEEFRLEYWNGCVAAWAASFGFIPITTISFRYTPLAFRVLAMNVQDCVWNAVVSYVAHRSRKTEKES